MYKGQTFQVLVVLHKYHWFLNSHSCTSLLVTCLYLLVHLQVYNVQILNYLRLEATHN